jgi:hypothetical protein
MPDNRFTLLLMEAGLSLIALAAAFLFPSLLATPLRKLELVLSRLARKKALAILCVAAAMLSLRLAVLPWAPAPHPFSTDDFSFLLAADTFSHGRLANPTPVMWKHLESIHITMQPTYMSMYFPGPGLMLAAGQSIFGEPWAGVLIASAAMCMALCWMLQGWLPPGWALLGSILLILRVGLFSYWSNSFTGGAPLTVAGGALVLGAIPRLSKNFRPADAMLLALGISLLAITRPYEGLLVTVPALIVLIRRVAANKRRPSHAVLLRRAVAPIALIVVVLAWIGYYDTRAFKHPTTLPYTVARSTYAVVPYYIWQPAHRVPDYRHVEMARFYNESEMVGFRELHTPAGFVRRNLGKLITTFLFFAGFALLPPLVLMRRALLDRRLRPLGFCIPFWIAGMAIGVFLIPHYLAPFTAAIYAFGLQAMRHLRVWKAGGQPVGMTLVRLVVVVCVVMAGLRVFAAPLNLMPPQWPIGPWLCTWIGPGQFGGDRARIAQQLEQMPGNHLVIVRYSATHEPGDEWVYNGAQIDSAKTIWAREMDAASNRELFTYYNARDVWLVQPDVGNGSLSPYSAVASR